MATPTQFFSASRPKDWVTKGIAYTFTFKAYSAGTQQVPSSATITIVGPGGVALTTPVTGATVTIAGGGDMTYALTAGNADTIGEDYSAVVTYVVSNVSHKGRFTFDVVLVPLRPVVVHADLALHHVDLSELFTGGETTTQNYIQTAFEDVCVALAGHGINPSRVASPSDLRRATEHRALELFFDDKVRVPGDEFQIHRDKHATRYETAKQALGAILVMDEDDSASVSSGEVGQHSTGYRIRS